MVKPVDRATPPAAGPRPCGPDEQESRRRIDHWLSQPVRFIASRLKPGGLEEEDQSHE